MITRTSDHIEVKGHVGTWYVIDEATYSKSDYGRVHVFLLEHEDYGDEAACVIVDADGELIMEDVWNGFGDLEDDGWEEYKND